MDGTGAYRFAPNAQLTRAMIVTILYRMEGGPAVSAASNGDNLASFSDLGTVSGYALESMNWAVGAGLLKGANGKLDPKANATRAQVAAIIHRYLER